MLMHAWGLTGHTLLCCTLYVLVQEGALERLPFTAHADLPDSSVPAMDAHAPPETLI